MGHPFNRQRVRCCVYTTGPRRRNRKGLKDWSNGSSVAGCVMARTGYNIKEGKHRQNRDQAIARKTRYQ
ncbi:hypothetical protein KCP74_20890 [Salmonella enterica subsp. enterica]|nr:hypothetical protein KCP74_20890 [Salmonella enterica subsp. enterica]